MGPMAGRFPMALDDTGDRLFSGYRWPASIVAINTATGPEAYGTDRAPSRLVSVGPFPENDSTARARYYHGNHSAYMRPVGTPARVHSK